MCSRWVGLQVKGFIVVLLELLGILGASLCVVLDILGPLGYALVLEGQLARVGFLFGRGQTGLFGCGQRGRVLKLFLPVLVLAVQILNTLFVYVVVECGVAFFLDLLRHT